MRIDANTDMNLDLKFQETEAEIAIEEKNLELAREWFEKTFSFEEKEELREEFEKDPVKFWRESRCDV